MKMFPFASKPASPEEQQKGRTGRNDPCGSGKKTKNAAGIINHISD